VNRATGLVIAAAVGLTGTSGYSAYANATRQPVTITRIIYQASAPVTRTVYWPRVIYRTRTVYRASPAAVPAASTPSQFTDSAAVVTQFYADINARNYPGAWALGGDNIGGSNYAAWTAGYATTASVSLGTFSQWGASQVQAALYAVQDDGSTKTYQGTYTVAGGVIVAADIVQVS
jgi:hypothetical protein